MKVHIVVTDDRGNTFEGEASLVARSSSPTTRQADHQPQGSMASALNFELPVRAFVKRYGRNLGGPQKFTLLLARLTKGKTGVPIKLKDVERHWNRMTGPMGAKYNRAYSTRAKENGWVDAPATGTYELQESWAKCLEPRAN